MSELHNGLTTIEMDMVSRDEDSTDWSAIQDSNHLQKTPSVATEDSSFFNKINEEIEVLRGRVDHQLKSLVTATHEDVEKLDRELNNLKHQSGGRISQMVDDTKNKANAEAEKVSPMYSATKSLDKGGKLRPRQMRTSSSNVTEIADNLTSRQRRPPLDYKSLFGGDSSDFPEEVLDDSVEDEPLTFAKKAAADILLRQGRSAGSEQKVDVNFDAEDVVLRAVIELDDDDEVQQRRLSQMVSDKKIAPEAKKNIRLRGERGLNGTDTKSFLSSPSKANNNILQDSSDAISYARQKARSPTLNRASLTRRGSPRQINSELPEHQMEHRNSFDRDDRLFESDDDRRAVSLERGRRKVFTFDDRDTRRRFSLGNTTDHRNMQGGKLSARPRTFVGVEPTRSASNPAVAGESLGPRNQPSRDDFSDDEEGSKVYSPKLNYGEPKINCGEPKNLRKGVAAAYHDSTAVYSPKVDVGKGSGVYSPKINYGEPKHLGKGFATAYHDSTAVYSPKVDVGKVSGVYSPKLNYGEPKNPGNGVAAAYDSTAIHSPTVDVGKSSEVYSPKLNYGEPNHRHFGRVSPGLSVPSFGRHSAPLFSEIESSRSWTNSERDRPPPPELTSRSLEIGPESLDLSKRWFGGVPTEFELVRPSFYADRSAKRSVRAYEEADNYHNRQNHSVASYADLRGRDPVADVFTSTPRRYQDEGHFPMWHVVLDRKASSPTERRGRDPVPDEFLYDYHMRSQLSQSPRRSHTPDRSESTNIDKIMEELHIEAEQSRNQSYSSLQQQSGVDQQAQNYISDNGTIHRQYEYRQQELTKEQNNSLYKSGNPPIEPIETRDAPSSQRTTIPRVESPYRMGEIWTKNRDPDGCLHGNENLHSPQNDKPDPFGEIQSIHSVIDLVSLDGLQSRSNFEPILRRSSPNRQHLDEYVRKQYTERPEVRTNRKFGRERNYAKQKHLGDHNQRQNNQIKQRYTAGMNVTQSKQPANPIQQRTSDTYHLQNRYQMQNQQIPSPRTRKLSQVYHQPTSNFQKSSIRIERANDHDSTIEGNGLWRNQTSSPARMSVTFDDKNKKPQRRTSSRHVDLGSMGDAKRNGKSTIQEQTEFVDRGKFLIQPSQNNNPDKVLSNITTTATNSGVQDRKRLSVSPTGKTGCVGIEHAENRVLLDLYGDRGIYDGVLVRGEPHGYGTMRYDDGRSYSGKWSYGRWHGMGKAIFANGDVYVGQYDRDQRQGVGRYEWFDGRVYDGEFFRDQRQGEGTYIWPDGASYSGEFFAGHRHGQGTYTFADGSVYSGEWKKGNYHGMGECVWSDGRCYRGEWANGRAHGYGVETLPRGTVRHDGLWNLDRPVRGKINVK